VIASDETSARVKGKTHWQWAFGCATAVYHVIAPTRGSACRRTFLPACGRRCGCRIACRRSAHTPRRTISASVGHRRPDLADSTIATHRRRLDRELDRLLDLKPTDVEGSHLRATIAVTARDKLLVFLTRRDVEATNNGGPR
jgi:transposase